jgi:ribosome-associated protein
MNNTETPGDAREPHSESTPESNPESIESKPSPSLDRFIRVTPPAPEGQVDHDRGIPRTTDVKNYSLMLAKAAAQVAIDNNGTEVLILDVCDQTALFDYFVLATGTSRRQLHAISEEIDDKLQKELGDHRMGIEGYEDSRWIVLDYGSVVIHLFDEETRSYYDLESLWADATVVPLNDLR